MLIRNKGHFGLLLIPNGSSSWEIRSGKTHLSDVAVVKSIKGSFTLKMKAKIHVKLQ